MKHFLLISVTVASLLVITAAPVTAQLNETEDLDRNSEDLENCPEPEAIDADTVLCDYELNNGVAELQLRSDGLNRITLTDSGAMLSPGPVPRERYTLRPNETNTVRMDIDTSNQYSGVTVDTGPVLYAVPLREPSTLIGGPWGATDTQLAAVSAGLSTALLSVVVVFRSILGRDEEPERIA